MVGCEASSQPIAASWKICVYNRYFFPVDLEELIDKEKESDNIRLLGKDFVKNNKK